MRGMAAWQLIVVGAVAVACIGGMSASVWKLFGRQSTAIGVARPGTAAESGHYAAEAPVGAAVFDGFSYRVSARFAGRSRAVVDGDRVVFCGPRGPRVLYAFWIWLQALLLAAVPVALVWAVAVLDWRPLVWALGLAVGATVVMAVGAGVWPGLGEVPGLTDGRYPALEMSRTAVRDVKVGPGWADGGLALVLAPYVKPIDALSVDHAVSWWGPDERGREVRFALHCYEPKQAHELAGLLRAQR